MQLEPIDFVGVREFVGPNGDRLGEGELKISGGRYIAVIDEGIFPVVLRQYGNERKWTVAYH